MEKWTEMMRPRNRDSGGNVAQWSPDGGGADDATFRRRVWKGIPDRWRSAAWQMMVDRMCASRGAKVKHGELAVQFRVSYRCIIERSE